MVNKKVLKLTHDFSHNGRRVYIDLETVSVHLYVTDEVHVTAIDVLKHYSQNDTTFK